MLKKIPSFVTVSIYLATTAACNTQLSTLFVQRITRLHSDKFAMGQNKHLLLQSLENNPM